MSTTSISSRPLLCGTLLLLAALTASAGAQTAADYPGKVVRIIMPYAAGGNSSEVTRVFADKFAKELGQGFILDNRPGGNTIIASEALMRATPDGHTLLVVTNTHIVNPFMQPKLPYDTLRDFAGVSALVRNDHMIALHPSVPAGTLKEFIAHARAYPDRMNAVVTGLGSHNHLENLLFMRATGTSYIVVPYKGSANAIGDLLSGEVQIYISNPSLFAPHIKAGKVKGIAVSGDKRNPLVPGVPTFSEAGLNGFVAANYYLLLAPARTPKDIVQKLNAQTARAQASADVQEMLARQGVDPFPTTVPEIDALIRRDMERYGKVIRDNNIKPEGY